MIESRYWAGSEESLHRCILADLEVGKQAYAPSQTQTEALPSRLLAVAEGVAVITIAGSLVNSGNADENAWRGRTSYSEIRQALIEAVNNPDVNGILLDISSGGGAVNGVQDTADLIRQIDVNIKPVYTYTDGQMASAAYWLGISARSVHISSVAEVGSVGVLSVHQEMSKMMLGRGITATVLRAGEFKALGNSMEPLSDKAKVEIQGQLDQLMTLFTSYAAARRGMGYEAFDSTAGQGRIFLGQRAVAMGLADSVTNFDSIVNKVGIDSQKNIDKYGPRFNTGSNVKIALTQQQIAAMAEGAEQITAEAQPAVTLTAAPTASVVVAEVVVAEVVAAAPAADASLVAYLQGQLSAAQAQVMGLTVAATAATEKAASTDGVLASFRAIAATSVDRLRIAMGGSAGAAAASDEALLAEHTALRGQFESKYKSGGVAAVSSQVDVASEGTDVAADARRLARIQATRPK